MGLAETANLAVDLKLSGAQAYTSGLAGIERANARLSSSTAHLSRTLGQVGGHISQGFGNAVRNLERIGVVAGGLALGGGAAAVKWAGDFEAQLNTINTVALTGTKELAAIGEAIKSISSKTGVATDDLTSAYYDLVSAGIKVTDAQSLLNNAVTLGIGGLATTTETVNLLATAYNAYGLDAAGAAKATDMFAQAIADGVVHADQIAASFADVASIAKTTGVGIDQIAASFAFLTKQGVAASEVTTEMQRAIISLMKPLPALKVAQKALGVDFLDEIRKKGLVPALQELRAYSDKTKIPLIELLGRVEAVKYVLQTTGPNAKGFAAELDNINHSAGMAAKQMAERQQGLNFQLDKLRANVKIAGITIGAALIPQLVELSDAASTFLQGHQDDIKTFAKNLAGGFRDAVAWARTLDLRGIADSLRSAAGFAKGLVQTFANAPAWLQTAVVTGWGLNKLTGGALTNIGGDIAKGIGGQFFARGAPGNPMHVFVDGSIPTGGGPGGGLGLGSLLAALGITVAAQGIANSTIPNGANPYNLPTKPSGFGPGLLDIDAIAAARNQGAPLPLDVSGRADTHSEALRIQMAGTAAVRANTAALRMNARDIERAWLKTVDPDKIAARSKAVTGKDATPAQIAAIRSRDLLNAVHTILTKSKQSSDQKLDRLRVLAADAKAHGDTVTARKIQAAIAKMKADLQRVGTETTGAVKAAAATISGAINNSDRNAYVTVNVSTSVSTDSVSKAATIKSRYYDGPK